MELKWGQTRFSRVPGPLAQLAESRGDNAEVVSPSLTWTGHEGKEIDFSVRAILPRASLS